MEGLVQFVDSFLSRDTKEKYNELKEICRKSNNLGQDFFELVLKKYGLILIENGELVPYEQVDIEKQNRITDYYGIKKSEKIINAYRELLVALHEERLLEAFSWELNNLNVQEIENLIKKKTNGKKEHKKIIKSQRLISSEFGNSIKLR